MNKSTDPKVAIVILNWNRYKDTIDCLESVFKLNYLNYQIILLDNGSSDNSVKKICEWCRKRKEPIKYVKYNIKTAKIGGICTKETEIRKLKSNRKLVIIESLENLGFAEGNNICFEYILHCPTSFEFIFLLNNDTLLDPNSLKRAVEVAVNKNCSIVGFIIKDMNGKIVFSGDWRRSELFYIRQSSPIIKLKRDIPSNAVIGCAMLIHKKALIHHKNLHGYYFDKNLFLYGEETEFCLNIKRAGHKIFIAKDAIVYHKISHSINPSWRESTKLYYMTRNAIFLANKLLSGGWLILFHLYFPIARLKVILTKLFELKSKEAFSIIQGLVDGYRKMGGKWGAQK
jgi:hypothetical protein